MSEEQQLVQETIQNTTENPVIIDPLYWLPIGIGIAGVAAGIFFSYVRSTKPKSNPTSTRERYLDYEKNQLVLTEDYHVENLDTRFYKKVLLFRVTETDDYEIWGYENGVIEQKILPYMIEDKKKSSLREIKIKNLQAIISSQIRGFKVVRYANGKELKDKVRKKEYDDRIEIINENSMEVRNYIFQTTESESVKLKNKNEIAYTFPKESHWWAVIEKIPGKIGEHPGKLIIKY